MPAIEHRHPYRRGACAGLALVLLVCSLAATAEAGQKQVLVLYATRRDAQIAVLADRELPRLLEQGLGGDTLDLYPEYLDLARFPDPGYQSALEDFLRQKYRDQRFDLVITMHDVALGFVAARRATLFPDVPIVFVSTNPRVVRLPHSTGIVAPVDFAGTVTLAANLQPAMRRVFVVSGADRRDAEMERQAREQFARFESRLAFTYLSGLPTTMLEQRLAGLPPDAIVYYLLVNRDGRNLLFNPLDYLDRITEVANVPVYSWVDSAFGRGIVGGDLKSQSRQIEAVSAVALRVLGGEPADDIPLARLDLTVPQVDWRQLRRWNLDEGRLPRGTIVAFVSPSVWERYRVYIVGAVLLLLTQSVLIGALLLERRHRRRAEEEVRGREGQLRHSYERIRDLAGRLLGAQDAERARIARELHDDVGQQLSLLSGDIELLSGLSDREGEAAADDAMQRLQAITRSVRDLSHQLHPARLRLVGLVTALDALGKESARSGLRVSFEHQDVPTDLPADLTLCLYRVVQEALQNAARHSRASTVRVALRGSPGELALDVSDDGVGFEPEAAIGDGLGLASMRERVDAAGGRIAIESAPGAGTRIAMRVPLPVVQAAAPA